MLLYSVWKPATSSFSASGRSNGTRLVSANAAIRKMMKLTICAAVDQVPVPDAARSAVSTSSRRLSVFEISSGAAIASDIGSS